MRKVDFLIAGAQKGGTTALDLYLRGHPRIRMAIEKEAHFFDTESHFATGEPDYARYHACFPDAMSLQGVLHGEATPSYMYWHAAPERIRRYNPDIKLVIILRNPIARAFSHWNMQRERGKDRLPFSQALAAEAERIRADLPLQNRAFSYVDRGFYVGQLRRVWQHIPRNQTLILRNEELRTDAQATLDRVCAFLGTGRMNNVMNVTASSRTYPVPMSPREWQYLAGVFDAEIRALEELLGWDCQAWLEPPGPPRPGPAGAG